MSNLSTYMGAQELDCIKNYSKNYQLISTYYIIDTTPYQSNMNEPPFVNHELIILARDNNNNYFVQAFTKKKFPNEFGNLNNIEYYLPLFPLEYSGAVDMVKYPIIEKCREKGLYSIQEANDIKDMISKILGSLPHEIVNLVYEKIVVSTYDLEKQEFTLISENELEDEIVIDNFYNFFSKKLKIVLKNK